MNFFKLDIDNLRENRLASFRKMVQFYNIHKLDNIIDWIYVEGFSKSKLAQAKRNIKELKPTLAAWDLLDASLRIYNFGGFMYVDEDRVRGEKKYFESDFVRSAIKEMEQEELQDNMKNYVEGELPF